MFKEIMKWLYHNYLIIYISSILFSKDYAGSGVVFLVGGTAALITSFVTNLHVEHWQTPKINKESSLPVSEYIKKRKP